MWERTIGQYSSLLYLRRGVGQKIHSLRPKMGGFDMKKPFLSGRTHNIWLFSGRGFCSSPPLLLSPKYVPHKYSKKKIGRAQQKEEGDEMGFHYHQQKHSWISRWNKRKRDAHTRIPRFFFSFLNCRAERMSINIFLGRKVFLFIIHPENGGKGVL